MDFIIISDPRPLQRNLHTSLNQVKTLNGTSKIAIIFLQKIGQKPACPTSVFSKTVVWKQRIHFRVIFSFEGITASRPITAELFFWFMMIELFFV